jgi:phage-related protein
MTTNQESTFTLSQVASDVGAPIGNTYKTIGINTLKTIGTVISSTVGTILYLFLLIPQLIQLIIFGLFLYIISKIWGSFKIIYQIIASMFNSLMPAILSIWNVIAKIFNGIGKVLRSFKVRLPTLPEVNPNKVKMPSKMPTAVEFAMLVLSPVANATKKSVHNLVYA